MENILDVYKRPYDPKRPLIGFDESNKQQIQDVIEPLPMKEGRVQRFESTYKRNDTRNLFMFFEPLAGKRRVKVTKRRTKEDFAMCMKELVNEMYPTAEKIVLVMDNLGTHHLGSLYETFSPKEAKRIADKLEIHYTPKRGSWLNIAECELSVLSRQCLKRRIGDSKMLNAEVQAWVKSRNRESAKCDWQFTIEDARIKLKSLYPKLIKNI
jgi:hypothetical protein